MQIISLWRKQRFLSALYFSKVVLWNTIKRGATPESLLRILIGIGLCPTPAWGSNDDQSTPALAPKAASSEFVRVEPGQFHQGSIPSETGRFSDETSHQVEISRPFLIGKTEITNAQMVQMLNLGLDREYIVASKSRISTQANHKDISIVLLNCLNSEISIENGRVHAASGKENHPCTGVTWYGAQVYANLYSMSMGLKPAIDIENWECDFASGAFRLPTESEWEYACRAGAKDSFGAIGTDLRETSRQTDNLARIDIDQFAWYGGNSAGKNTSTAPVGTKLPNGWGLYDMHGNVSEWCWDWYGTYDNQDAIDPSGPTTGWRRVIRGGDYLRATRRIRSAKREAGLPFNEGDFRGFRIVQTVVAPE